MARNGHIFSGIASSRNSHEKVRSVHQPRGLRVTGCSGMAKKVDGSERASEAEKRDMVKKGLGSRGELGDDGGEVGELEIFSSTRMSYWTRKRRMAWRWSSKVLDGG